MKAIFLLLSTCTLLHAQEVLDGVAAMVGDQTITFNELRERVAPQVALLRERLKGEELVDAIKQARQAALEQLIDRQLLLQELSRQGVPLLADPTDEKIDAIIKERFHSDREQWLKRLRRSASIKKF